jgi:hypothetical protein
MTADSVTPHESAVDEPRTEASLSVKAARFERRLLFGVGSQCRSARHFVEITQVGSTRGGDSHSSALRAFDARPIGRESPKRRKVMRRDPRMRDS